MSERNRIRTRARASDSGRERVPPHIIRDERASARASDHEHDSERADESADERSGGDSWD